MAEIIKGLTNLVQSFFQIIYGTVATVVNTVVGTFEAAINFVVGLIKSVFNVSEDLLKLIVGKSRMSLLVMNISANELVLGNLTLIITLFIAYWGYVIYQQRQGNRNPQPLNEIAGKVKAATKNA